MKQNKLRKRMGAVFMTALLTAGLIPTAASADLPDPNETGSITVHKLATMGESLTNHNGTEIADTTSLGSKLPGATFALYRVNDGVELDETADPDILAVSGDVTMVGTPEVTDANGEIKWDNLAVGYYVLVETQAPAGYTKSASAIITLPYGYYPDSANGQATTEYNYDVHVYPKNVNTQEVTKVVKDPQSSYVVGDPVTWEIGAKLDSSKDLFVDSVEKGVIKVTDILDARLSYTGGAVLTLTGGAGSVGLVKDTDYSETVTADPVTGAQTIVWQLTDSGLEKAQNQSSTGLIVNIPTTVNDKAQGGSNSSIENSAEVEIEYTDGSDGGGEPDVKPVIQLGGVIINKTERDGTTKLANAKFKLALSEADAQSGTYLQDAGNTDIEVTTDAQGFAQFVDFSQTAVDWSAANTFYLVETQAPAGFLLKQEAVKVITTDDSTLSGTPQKQTTVTILNQKPTDPPIEGEKPTFKLPLTGGIGTMVFIVGGIALMAAAAIILIRNRRQAKR